MWQKDVRYVLVDQLQLLETEVDIFQGEIFLEEVGERVRLEWHRAVFSYAGVEMSVESRYSTTCQTEIRRFLEDNKELPDNVLELPVRHFPPPPPPPYRSRLGCEEEAV